MGKMPPFTIDVELGPLTELKGLLEDVVALLERCGELGVHLQVELPAVEEPCQ